MTAARKFLFDVSFDAPPPPPPPPEEPKVALAELEAAREAAFAAGRQAATAEAIHLAETRIAAALDATVAAMAQLGRTQHAKLAEVERDVAVLVATVLSRISPTLAKHRALDDIATFVAQSLGEAADEPRVVLRVADDLFEAVRARVVPLAEAAGFSGKLVILGDEALGPADARVEWADGGAERDVSRLAREIEATALRVLEAPAAPQPEQPVREAPQAAAPPAGPPAPEPEAADGPTLDVPLTDGPTEDAPQPGAALPAPAAIEPGETP
jgi:flagellar assembly protein FliH